MDSAAVKIKSQFRAITLTNREIPAAGSRCQQELAYLRQRFGTSAFVGIDMLGDAVPAPVQSASPAILEGHLKSEERESEMTDIYATPGADLSQHVDANRAGGNVDDAVRGNFEIGMLETLGEAWRSLGGFKLGFWVAILLQVLAGFVIGVAFGMVIGILAQSGGDQSVLGLFNLLFQLVITLVMLPMSIAVLVMAMRHANRRSVSASEIFRHFDVVASLAAAYLLLLVLILLGLVLLLLPGLYLAVAYFYAMPLVLEKKMGVWRALETSRRAITQVWFRMLGLLIVLWFVNLLGLLTIIGWIWTLPLSLLTLALVYQKIFGVEAQTLAE